MNKKASKCAEIVYSLLPFGLVVHISSRDNISTKIQDMAEASKEM